MELLAAKLDQNVTCYLAPCTVSLCKLEACSLAFAPNSLQGMEQEFWGRCNGQPTQGSWRSQWKGSRDVPAWVCHATPPSHLLWWQSCLVAVQACPLPPFQRGCRCREDADSSQSNAIFLKGQHGTQCMCSLALSFAPPTPRILPDTGRAPTLALVQRGLYGLTGKRESAVEVPLSRRFLLAQGSLRSFGSLLQPSQWRVI